VKKLNLNLNVLYERQTTEQKLQENYKTKNVLRMPYVSGAKA